MHLRKKRKAYTGEKQQQMLNDCKYLLFFILLQICDR